MFTSRLHPGFRAEGQGLSKHISASSGLVTQALPQQAHRQYAHSPRIPNVLHCHLAFIAWCCHPCILAPRPSHLTADSPIFIKFLAGPHAANLGVSDA